MTEVSREHQVAQLQAGPVVALQSFQKFCAVGHKSRIDLRRIIGWEDWHENPMRIGGAPRGIPIARRCDSGALSTFSWHITGVAIWPSDDVQDTAGTQSARPASTQAGGSTSKNPMKPFLFSFSFRTLLIASLSRAEHSAGVRRVRKPIPASSSQRCSRNCSARKIPSPSRPSSLLHQL